MQRTDNKEEGIMGKVSRMLCGLFVIMLAGAACCCKPTLIKNTDSTAKQMLVITVDPETGSVVAVEDNRGKTLNPANQSPTKVGTLTTSTTPITNTVELLPAGDTPPGTVGGCRIVIVNGVARCI